MYAKSAPMACAARIAPPEAMAPDSATGPSNHSRISCTMANGLLALAWPPAPAATGIRPSAPFSIALCANTLLMTSCSTTPPQPCTAWFTSSRAPSEVMTIGTLYLAHNCMSCSSRSLLLCTIWLMANGAAGSSGCALSHAASASVISASHSSSCSAGRALSAGMEPTTPDVHWAITSLGLLMMNNGEPMTGNFTRCRTGGNLDMGMLSRADFNLRTKKAASACPTSASSYIKNSKRSEGFQRQRRHAARAIDDGIARARHASQDVVGIEARRGDFRLHEGGILTRGQLLLGR